MPGAHCKRLQLGLPPCKCEPMQARTHPCRTLISKEQNDLCLGLGSPHPLWKAVDPRACSAHAALEQIAELEQVEKVGGCSTGQRLEERGTHGWSACDAFLMEDIFQLLSTTHSPVALLPNAILDAPSNCRSTWAPKSGWSMLGYRSCCGRRSWMPGPAKHSLERRSSGGHCRQPASARCVSWHMALSMECKLV